MEYRYRMTQDALTQLLDTAQARMKANKDIADEFREDINKYPYFKTEKDALQAAIAKMKKEPASNFQIWAKIEKVDDVVRIKNWWIVTDDWKVKQAADYIGMALMYDAVRLRTIIFDNVKIDDVIAYW